VKDFFWHRSWQRKTSWAAITRWEQGGNKRRASIDEPPQLTSVDLHVAVSRPLRNNCGCAKSKSPWRIRLRAATRCNTVDVSSRVDGDGHAALHILCNYGERGHGAKASRGGLGWPSVLGGCSGSVRLAQGSVSHGWGAVGMRWTTSMRSWGGSVAAIMVG